jgi:hypothetical protein
LRLFRGGQEFTDEFVASRIQTLTGQSKRIGILRRRLGDLSWFMRCLNEPVARRANREDGCSGRFWEGRFKCQALLDDPAVLACMVYVDLNPVRAGDASTPESSRYTSLSRRCGAKSVAGLLGPVASSIPQEALPMTTAKYLELVDWTGRILHPGKLGRIPGHAPAILARIAVRPAQWLCQVPATESGYWRVIGRAESIAHQAQQLGQHWLRGIGFAKRVESIPETR